MYKSTSRRPLSIYGQVLVQISHSIFIYIYSSIISPEDFEDPDVFITIEKDPQQEEFLQGRMQSNPYNVRDSSIGPLMRDVKNKICRDTELLALLEEDTGSFSFIINIL